MIEEVADRVRYIADGFRALSHVTAVWRGGLLPSSSSGAIRHRCCCWLHPGADAGRNLRRALLLSRGDWGVLVTRPISAGLLIASALLLVIVLLPAVKAKREEAFVEE